MKHTTLLSSSIASISLFVLLSCGTSKSSDLKVIQAQTGAESAELRVVGSHSQADGTKEFFLVAGRNLHVVYDCDSVDELNTILDTTLSGNLDNADLDVILQGTGTEDSLQRRSDLSCKTSFLPRSPAGELGQRPDSFGDLRETRHALYYSSEKYYFTSGQVGEYYAVDTLGSPCVYNLSAKLFAFEDRAQNVINEMPSDLNKTISLSCGSSKDSKYRLLVFTPAAGTESRYPFSTVVLLGYDSKSASGDPIRTVLPFHRIDGALIKAESPEFKSFVDGLKDKFKVSDVTKVTPAEIARYRGKALFDYCLNACGPNFTPNVEIMSTTVPVVLQAAANKNKTLSTADISIRGQQVIELKVDSNNQFRFVGCDSNFTSGLGLQSSDQDWFKSLKAQMLGQSIVQGNVFECPASTQPVTCTKILDRATYSVAEFSKILEDKTSCPNKADLLLVKVDSNVTIEGTDPIRLNSNLPYSNVRFQPVIPSDRRMLTYRYICANKEKCLPSSNTPDVRVFNLAGNKSVSFEDIELKASVDSKAFLAEKEVSTLRFQAFEVIEAAQLNMIRSTVEGPSGEGRNHWNTGVKLTSVVTDSTGFALPNVVKSRFSCFDCSINVSGVAVEAQDSLVLISGTAKTSSLIRGLSSATALRGSSEGVFQNATLEGETLSTIGTSGHAYFKGLSLRILGNTLVKPISVFIFMNKGNGTDFTLDIQDSEVHGLPAEQVGSFYFADYSPGDLSAILNLRATKFFRNGASTTPESEITADSAPFFLRCKGVGKLLYRFKNQCQP